jgi:hypothetical protein
MDDISIIPFISTYMLFGVLCTSLTRKIPLVADIVSDRVADVEEIR